MEQIEQANLYRCEGKEFEYGVKNDQIHPFFKSKREWSRVKDRIVGTYIQSYLRTTHRRGRPIIIVDAFSGPGKFGDGSDGSPVMLCKLAEENLKRSIAIRCIFSDVHPSHREALETNIAPYVSAGVAEKPMVDFSESLAKALATGRASTLFFYLDPYGIKDLDFNIVKQIYDRGTQQSTEVLINFNFRAFMRTSGNWDFNDSITEIERKVKAAKTDTINAVMGGDYWQKIITDPKTDKLQREDLVVDAYKTLVRRYFQYTCSIPVKELEESDVNVPKDELAKYHLIFSTRSARAVRYMNDAANLALESYFDQFKDGLLFALTPERFKPASADDIKAAIIGEVTGRTMTRSEIYEAVIPNYFMHYRTKNYTAFIYDLIKAGGLFPNPRTIKRKDKINDDTELSIQPWK